MDFWREFNKGIILKGVSSFEEVNKWWWNTLEEPWQESYSHPQPEWLSGRRVYWDPAKVETGVGDGHLLGHQVSPLVQKGGLLTSRKDSGARNAYTTVHFHSPFLWLSLSVFSLYQKRRQFNTVNRENGREASLNPQGMRWKYSVNI